MPFLPEKRMICLNRRFRESITVTNSLLLSAIAANTAIQRSSDTRIGTRRPRRF